jgi:hypothetical protein
VAAFALGATIAASAGHLADRAFEIAVFACMLAGVVSLFVALSPRQGRAKR